MHLSRFITELQDLHDTYGDAVVLFARDAEGNGYQGVATGEEVDFTLTKSGQIILWPDDVEVEPKFEEDDDEDWDD